MCCLLFSSSLRRLQEPVSPIENFRRLLNQKARLKLTFVSALMSLLFAHLLIFLLYSYVHKSVWTVYPIQNKVLVYSQVYILLVLLQSTMFVYFAAGFSCCFHGAMAMGVLVLVATPLLSIVFLAHLFFRFHIFYLTAFHLAWVVTLVFFYCYEGYVKETNAEIRAKQRERLNNPLTRPLRPLWLRCLLWFNLSVTSTNIANKKCKCLHNGN